MEITKEQWLDRISADRVEVMKERVNEKLEKKRVEDEKYTKRLLDHTCMYREPESEYPCPIGSTFACSSKIIPDESRKDDLANYFFCSSHNRNLSEMNKVTLTKIEELTGLTPKDLCQTIFGQ